ncbi:NTP pyrophosphohydrolase-like domain [Vibrio phage 1.067.O._10N.261.52.C9]|nr:NTP pyrophosphohydrolase-like domain [Vibrio phage 1.067.O._10N.261.52.C9]
MSLEKTKQWFEQAIPEPTLEQACIQIGCHYEEFSEMLMANVDDSASILVDDLAGEYKKCDAQHVSFIKCMDNEDKQELLDSLVDQIVTAVGVGHMMGMDVLGALDEVNRSNFSKLVDGKAVFDENGKIDKPESYSRPNLEKFV